MRKFDHSFLKDGHLNDILRLSKLIAPIRTKEEFGKQQYSELFKSLEEKAIIESAVGSNAIEGIGTYRNARYIKK